MNYDFDVHVCMVSAQTAPNLLPVLDERFAPKNRRVVMLVSPEMKRTAVNLGAVFRKNGLKVETLPIEDSFESVQNALLDYLGKNEHEKTALNATGGTKIMAFAAYSVFAELDLPIFYVRKDRNSLTILRPKTNKEFPELPIESKLTLEDYLGVYGYATKQDAKQSTVNKPQFVKELISNSRKYEQPLGTLNFLVSREKNKAKLKFDGLSLKKGGEMENMRPLLELCKKQGLLNFTDTAIEFKDRNSRDYICGGWLEEHVQDIVSSLPRDRIQTRPKQNLTITSKDDVSNEIDVAFLANDTLFAIECKTANLAKEGGSDVLYKMETVGKGTGLRTKTMLVTFRKLSAPHKKRAEKYGIEVVQGNDLIGLRTFIQKWIGK